MCVEKLASAIARDTAGAVELFRRLKNDGNLNVEMVRWMINRHVDSSQQIAFSVK